MCGSSCFFPPAGQINCELPTWLWFMGRGSEFFWPSSSAAKRKEEELEMRHFWKRRRKKKIERERKEEKKTFFLGRKISEMECRRLLWTPKIGRGGDGVQLTFLEYLETGGEGRDGKNWVGNSLGVTDSEFFFFEAGYNYAKVKKFSYIKCWPQFGFRNMKGGKVNLEAFFRTFLFQGSVEDYGQRQNYFLLRESLHIRRPKGEVHGIICRKKKSSPSSYTFFFVRNWYWRGESAYDVETFSLLFLQGKSW